MIVVLSEPVCKCGSNEVLQGCQSHDSSGDFHTKKWWEEHPHTERPNIQMMVAVSDPTNYKCSKCGYTFSYDECELVIGPLFESDILIPLRSGKAIIKEEIGEGIINPRGLEHVRITR